MIEVQRRLAATKRIERQPEQLVLDRRAFLQADERAVERAAGFEDMRRRVPDASKLYEYTGFSPRIALDQTLREVIDYELSVSGAQQPAVRSSADG